MDELLGNSLNDVNPWCYVKEFDVPKHIVPLSLKYLKGDETTAKPEFRDKDGGTYRLVFKDMDNGGKERKMENSWPDFLRDIQQAKVVIGKPYQVQRTHDKGAYIWKWTPKQA